MKTPVAEIKVNGKAVASIFNERLIGVTITDKEGVTSDTISCELNDGNPFAAIPRKGDTITASLGYLETGLAFFGSYTADDPEVRCLPYGMTVNGKGANVRDQAKQHRSRHWDKKTVKDIVAQIAAENGLSPVVDDAVGAYEYAWFGQQDESDLHVVERLARRHGALFSIKDGKLIFAAKGSGRSAGGKGLTAVVASPANIVEGTCRTGFAHRNRFEKVKARHHDRDKAELVEVEEESDSEGSADYTLSEPFADVEEATRAAKAKARDLKSETIRTSVTLFGDPAIRAGAPFRYSGVRPELDAIEFIIETATHVISKSGYTTQVEAKLKPEASTEGDGQGSGASGADTPAPPTANAPPIPAIPDAVAPAGQGGIGSR
ncbi:phage late control D family protein [Kaistia nematophila]|uniref:Contractile injection system protein, VgrG/Pvc8 family n=1 Tax=Kaistia nematophila TaxID=2994654 RepID=A0A9X3E467_9HYPH|nr:contractile injection system protein, VgrG/Pvc8 family [Kaistia nematophila]MCX5571496.1 contractile injection system protein, VgrG/Pvc8 family [Kaistia nematophila]